MFEGWRWLAYRCSWTLVDKPQASGRKTRQQSPRRQLDEKRTRLQSPSGALGSLCAALRCAPQSRASAEGGTEGARRDRKRRRVDLLWATLRSRTGLAGLAPLSYSSLVTDHLQHLCTIRVFFLLRWPLTNYTTLNGRRPSRERHDDLDDSDDKVFKKREEKFICNRR